MATKFSIKDIPLLIKETFKEWLKDRPLDQSAIVSFYSIFALPGLLMIIITFAGSILGQKAVEGKIQNEIGEIIGKDAARNIQTLIANVYTEGSSGISTVIGIIVLLFAATGVFSALQRSLNKTWKVKPDPKKSGIKKILINRVISFAMILAIGFLLLVSLLLSSLLSVMAHWVKINYSEHLFNIPHIINFLFTFGLITTMFALIYKYLPDAKIPWKSVWIGATLASVLFIIGKSSISIYFKTVHPGSPYGVAGFFILLILWITYSCLVLFLAAKFILVFTRRYIHSIEPSWYAVKE